MTSWATLLPDRSDSKSMPRKLLGYAPKHSVAFEQPAKPGISETATEVRYSFMTSAKRFQIKTRVSNTS